MRKPKHIAVIPDGNRRWAASRGLSKEAGYQHGLRPALELLRQAKEIGIEEITFYGFTTDNCKRICWWLATPNRLAFRRSYAPFASGNRWLAAASD